jgi:diguanylate cyclase (GGDEF)-like protein
MTLSVSPPYPQPTGLLNASVSADLVRLALDQLSQAVFLYRPEFDGERIVDLEIVYCNRAALSLPLNKDIVPGAFASQVFIDHQVALDAAQVAWDGGTPATYVVVRQGVVNGRFETVRFEITTGRAGELLLQTSHDFTVDDQLARSEERLRTIVQSLEEAVVLYEPVFDVDLRIVDVRTVFRNERADALLARIAGSGGATGLIPTTSDLADAWYSSEPRSHFIDNLDGDDATLPPLVLEIRLSRIDQHVLQTVRDHTASRLATRADDDAKRRLAAMLDVVGEGVGIFDPILDDDGNVVDFVLSFANAAMATTVTVGRRAGDIRVADIDPVALGRAALAQPGEPLTMLLTLDGVDPQTTWRSSVVAFDGQVVLVAADVTDLNQALDRVTKSDAMLRTVLESLAESVRVFDADGYLTYANAASEQLLGPADDPDAYEVCDVDGTPLDHPARPLERCLRGETIDDLVVAIGRPDLDDNRLCRVTVRPIVDCGAISPSAVVVSAHDITETTMNAARAQWMSTHVIETGLLNRQGLIEVMRNRCGDDPEDVAVLWIRLRALDTIRPTFGFDAGDAVVRAAADRIDAIARRFAGTAAHTTPNELVLVVPDDGDVALRVADLVTAELSSPVEVSGARLPVDPSIGFVTTHADDCNVDEVLHRAKMAAWAADREGGRHVEWRPDLGVDQRSRIELLGDMPRAMAAGEIFFRYQPKFDVATGHLVGAEALARWERSDQGLVPPDQFIPAIEASGLAYPFTVWAIEQVMNEWSIVRTQLPHATISVNVPGPLIGDPDFADAVHAIVERVDLPAGVLVLEITERTVARSVDAIASGISRFAAFGVGVSIDDFGTGQSSLEYLRRLRPTEIKIDRAFVSGAGRDAVDRSVLKASIDIGHAAQLSVCGEGVETEDELDLLRTLGCTTVQGFLLARPGTIAELLAAT